MKQSIIHSRYCPGYRYYRWYGGWIPIRCTTYSQIWTQLRLSLCYVRASHYWHMVGDDGSSLSIHCLCHGSTNRGNIWWHGCSTKSKHHCRSILFTPVQEGFRRIEYVLPMWVQRLMVTCLDRSRDGAVLLE